MNAAKLPPFPAGRPETPYVGLVPYAEDDASFFFGRDAEKRIVVGNLRASRLTILYGASGVGKTSLLRAGVLHDLRAQIHVATQSRPERAPFAICAFAAWRDDPLGELMTAIHAAAVEALGGRELRPWRPNDPVVATLREWTEHVRTLLVVLDQFEDYFLYHPDEDDDATFAGALPALVNNPNLRVNILVSIREDAWAKLDRFEGRIPQLFRNYIRVEHLSQAAAREAIEGPIGVWNRGLPPGEQPYRLEATLVEAVIAAADAGGLAPSETPAEQGQGLRTTEAIEAPFLQLVMQRLWRAAAASGTRVLTRATLEQLGGAQRIVENHLLDALGALSAPEKAVAADLFRFLVTRAKTKIAHAASDLAEWTKRPEPEVSAVLDKLCRGESGRILRRVPPPATGGESMRYELFHDVLAEPILEWRRGYEQERARHAALRRLVRVGGALLSLVAVFAALGIWALLQRSDAKRATRSVTSLALASAARTQLGAHLDRSLLLGLEAYRTSPSPEAAGAMTDALEKQTRAGFEAILRAGEGVRATAFSPDRRTFASAGFDGTLRLWDVQARRQLGEPLPEDTGEVWGVAFSPDGRTLAAAGEDGTVRLWDTRARAPLAAPLRDRGGAVLTVAFSPDGRLLAAAGNDGAVWLRDAHNFGSVAKLRAAHPSRIVTINFAPDGRTLAAAGDDGIVRIWDVRSRTLSEELRNEGNGAVLSVAFSPNGHTLAAAGQDGAVRLWDPRTHRLLGKLDAGAGPVWGVAFSRDGRTLASSGFNDSTVRLWDVRSRTPLEPLRGHTRAVVNVAFSPDRRTLASSGYDGTVLLWDVRSGQPPPHILRGHRGRVVSVTFSPGGRTLVSAGFDRTLRVWNLVSGRMLRPFPTDGADAVESVAFSPDGRTLASGGDDGLVRLWQVQGRRLLGPPLADGEGAIHSVAFSPDGHLVAAGGDNGHVRVWDVQNHHAAGSSFTGHHGQVWGIGFSPDGDTLASAGFDGTVRLWDMRTHKPAGRLPLAKDDLPLSIAFSPDGHTLAFGEVRGWIRLWDVRRRAWLGQPLKAHTTRIESVAFSPDGRALAAAGDDGTVWLWDVRGHRQLGRPLDDQGGAVFSVAFSPDGRTLASANEDGTVRLWHDILWRNLGDLRSRMCRLVVGNLTRSEWAELVPGLPYHTTCAA